MMQNKLRITILFTCLATYFITAQELENDIKIHTEKIKLRSQLWNTSYNTHDSLSFYSLFDSLTIITSAGGRWIGGEDCKRLCRKLYAKRPDISWTNTLKTIEINKQWSVAYENGDWIEAWTEKGDSSKSKIIGKYWMMWKYKENNWFIHSAIFTPLSCEGSYCK